MLEILTSDVLIQTGNSVCTSSIRDFDTVIVASGAIYAMRCKEGGECRDCEKFSIDEIVIYIPRRLYHCLSCLIGEFYNAGLFNIAVSGVVLQQRRAYVIPPMAKERADPERFVKRARGILENYALRIIVESLPLCCRQLI